MFGAKVSNLLLGEKNFIDHTDKNLGQERERLLGDELELDPVCTHLRGGSSFLDYPAMISHDFCDITSAIDIYVCAFTKSTSLKVPPRFCSGIFPAAQVKNDRLNKMPFRGDELTVAQFINAFVQASVKIRSHLIECIEECTVSGRLENLYVIISNVAMIRNYIWMFQQIFNPDPKANEKLKAEYKEHRELLESVSDRLIQCQMNLLTTYVIHDEISQNFDSTQYFEGQRGSPTVQMWAYFLNGVKRDMWKIMPAQLAQRVLAILLNDSLAILTARYSKIDPAEESTVQFCADIINILETVEELLLSVSTTLDEFSGEMDPSTAKVIFSIHLKCACLMTTLLLVGAPLEVLYKTFRRGLSYCSLLDKPKNDFELTQPMWMQALYTLCSKYHPKLDITKWELVSTLRLLVAQPSVNWTLVYKVIALNEFTLARLVLEAFHAKACPATIFLLEGNGFQKCLNAGCIFENCHSLPKCIPDYHVSSSIFYILAHTIPRGDLAAIYHGILPRVVDWSVMDRTQVWTSTKRPAWFQNLIDLLLPILKTCVQGLCFNLITGNKGEDEDSTQFVVELLNSVTDLLSIIPKGFFLICEDIDDFIPPTVFPVRNSVPVHFLVTTLYQLLNLGSGIIESVQTILKSAPPSASANQDVQNILPTLLSTSERLCHINDGDFDQTLHRLVTQIESMMRHTQTELEKRESENLGAQFLVTDDLSTLKVNFILEELEGQIALWIVYWFLMTNAENIQASISDVTTILVTNSSETAAASKNAAHSSHRKAFSSKVVPAPPQADPKPQQPTPLFISPSTRTYRKSVNTVHHFHFVNRSRTFDEIVWNFNQNLDWVSTIRDSKMGLDKATIFRQLQRRPEFKISNEAQEISGEKELLLQKMVTEIKALMAVRSN